MLIEKYVLIQEDLNTFKIFLIMNLADFSLEDDI